MTDKREIERRLVRVVRGYRDLWKQPLPERATNERIQTRKIKSAALELADAIEANDELPV